MEIELTPEEEKAIKSLQRVAGKWPDTLMIHCSGGYISVRKPDEQGNYFADREVGMVIGIRNDGGDGGDLH